MTLDTFSDILTEPLPARVAKVLNAAAEHGWAENPVVSLTIRLAKPDDIPEPRSGAVALPFFATWHLFTDPESGKRSWRFASARAKNGQALNYSDIFIYLEDPDVIYPEPPEGEDDDNARAGNEVGAEEAGAPLG